MHSLNLTGVNLLYVGIALFINGLWLLNKIEKKEIIFINFFVGFVSFMVAFKFVFSAEATQLTIKAGALTFLFSCTYLWVSFNQYSNASGHGLGWYCLFVAITAIPITINLGMTAQSPWELWFACCWGLWVVLWFVYFLNLVFACLKQETVGWITLTIGIISAWIPGYLLINNLVG